MHTVRARKVRSYAETGNVGARKRGREIRKRERKKKKKKKKRNENDVRTCQV